MNAVLKHRYALLGSLLAFGNLYLAYLFRFDLVPLKLPYDLIGNFLYLDNPVYNFGGFFVDGSEPTVRRLPTVIILIYISLFSTDIFSGQGQDCRHCFLFCC